MFAENTDALALGKADYPVAHYIPREDVDVAALCRSTKQTCCPYKGDASCFDIPAGGERSVDAVWCYEKPYEAVSRIKEYLAFYGNRVDRLNVSDDPTDKQTTG